MYIVKKIVDENKQDKNLIRREVFKVVEMETKEGKKVEVLKSFGILSLFELENLENMLTKTISEMQEKLKEITEQISEYKKV